LSTIPSARRSRPVEVTVETAARLFATTPAKIRRAVAREELEAEEYAGRLLVRVDLERTTLTAPQAARLLGVGSPTIRRDVATGRLKGEHEGHAYRIPLREVAADRRFPHELRALLLQEQPPAVEEAHPTRRRSPELARAVVPLNVMLRPEDAEALSVGVERFGTKRAAVAAALRQLGASIPFEAELRRRDRELEEQDEALDQARDDAAKAKERVARLPDELYCHGCSAWIPLEQFEQEDDRELGGLAWIHRHEGLAAVMQGRATAVGRRKYG
jgi:excisionase family DNA binding protein